LLVYVTARSRQNCAATPQVPVLTEEEVGGAMATFNMWATEDGMLEYSLEVTDIEGLTMAHIHIGNSTESGAVAVQLVPEASGLLPYSLLTDCCLLEDCWLSSACLALHQSQHHLESCF
jgi:hypothetical protein